MKAEPSKKPTQANIILQNCVQIQVFPMHPYLLTQFDSRLWSVSSQVPFSAYQLSVRNWSGHVTYNNYFNTNKPKKHVSSSPFYRWELWDWEAPNSLFKVALAKTWLNKTDLSPSLWPHYGGSALLCDFGQQITFSPISWSVKYR